MQLCDIENAFETKIEFLPTIWIRPSMVHAVFDRNHSHVHNLKENRLLREDLNLLCRLEYAACEIQESLPSPRIYVRWQCSS